MSITISQIAKEAGVSVAAVSKALNGKKDISPATSKRIQELAAKMGYSVNLAAQSLVLKKTMTIGIVLPFPELITGMKRIQGIQNSCDEKGYLTTCTFHHGDPDEEIQRLSYLRGRVDGIIITPTGHSEQLKNIIKSLAVPVIFMSETVLGVDVDYVGDDDESGGYLAVSHLLKGNNKNFAYFGNNPNISSDRSVLIGAHKASDEYGYDSDANIELWGNISQKATEANLDKLLNQRADISNIFCFSDMTALWVIQKLVALGKKIPDEFSVVGYDNILFSTMAKIPLTSISQPNLEIGIQAATLLFERIKEKEQSKKIKKNQVSKKIIFNPKLVIRESSRS
jgi:DNA-binding LacI/PurR family transcriptional regulator